MPIQTHSARKQRWVALPPAYIRGAGSPNAGTKEIVVFILRRETRCGPNTRKADIKVYIGSEANWVIGNACDGLGSAGRVAPIR